MTAWEVRINARSVQWPSKYDVDNEEGMPRNMCPTCWDDQQLSALGEFYGRRMRVASWIGQTSEGEKDKA